MKFLFIISVLFFFIFNNSYIQANATIAFIDVDYILKKSEEGKKILNDLNKINSKNLEQFKNEELELSKEQEEIKKLQNIISFEEYNKKLTSFQNKVDIYNKKKTKIIKSFEETKNKELSYFFDNLNQIMNKYMKDNSIIIILDKKTIVMANKKSDISEEILKIVNTNE